MKMFCISDSIENALGMKLTGVESCVLTEKESIDKKIDEILQNPEIGILIVSKTIFQISQEKLDYIKEFKRLPLIVQI